MSYSMTPSSVMYAQLKAFGISNRDAAAMLLNTTLTFDGRVLSDRINESSQLSRRIVHTKPGELSRGLFNNFGLSCPRIWQVMVDRACVVQRHGSASEAQAALEHELATTCTQEMLDALRATGVDESLYRNMVAYISRVELLDPGDRGLLYLMMLVITGCLGNPKVASVMVVDYATNVLGADFNTAQTIINAGPRPDGAAVDTMLGLVRVVDGRIKAGSKMHVLNPAGTEIGLLPTARHMVADVDEDVSRRHAQIWREEGHWYLCDLGSTNGTRIMGGTTGTQTVVTSEPVEIQPTDIICLGATTRFIVMPMLGV